MEISKFGRYEAGRLLAHYNRIENSPDNLDIDPERTPGNYSLTPYLSVSREEYQSSRDARMRAFKEEKEHYKQRLSEVFCYNRADVKTLVDCVVTLPEEVRERDDAEIFFETVYEFLANRYGGVSKDGRSPPNVISATVHSDESTLGQPHLHFSFIPVVEIDKVRLMEKKNHIKEMEMYDYKVSAKEVCGKKDLATLHQDLQAYLDKRGVKGRVLKKSADSGKTINIPIEVLKDYSSRHGGKKIDADILRGLTLDRLEEMHVKAKEYEKIKETEISKQDYFRRNREREKELIF